MTSRTLFYNLMREDLKKKSWIIVVALITFIFINPVHALMVIEGMYQNTYLTQEILVKSIQYYLSAGYFGNTVLPAILAIVLGIIGFSYLFSKKKVDLYHSIPVRRNKLFFSSYLNGILIYIGVYLVTQLLTIMTIAMQGLMTADGWKIAGMTFLGTTIHFLFFYHVTIIAVMLTGNMLVCVAAVMTLLFYGPMICQLIDGFFSHYFATYYADYTGGNSWLIMPFVSPVSSLIYYSTVSDGEKGNIGLGLLAAFLIAAALLVVAVLLYRKRPSEVAGRALTYKISEPIIRILVVIPVAMLGGLYIQNMSNGSSGLWFWFGLLFVGIICHVAMEIVYRFDFNEGFNHKLQLAASLAVASLMALCIQYDWMGYDRYIPSENQIASAAVSFQSIDRDTNGYEVTINANGEASLKYVDKNTDVLNKMYLTNIQDVLALAQAGVDQLDYSSSNQNHVIPIAVRERIFGTYNANSYTSDEKNQYTIRYRLKNGKEITRNYSTTIDSVFDVMAKIYAQKEYKDAVFSLLKVKDSGIITSVSGYNVWGDKVLSATGNDMKELLDIYTSELQNLTLDTVKKELPLMRLDSMFKSDGYEDSIYGYYIYPSFMKTISKIKELGVKEEEYKAEIIPEDIDSITVNDYGFLAALDGEENVNYNASITYTTDNGSDDQAKIKELCEHLVLGNFLWSNSILHPVEQSIDFSLELHKTTGKEQSGYANLRRGEIPIFLEKELRENAVYY